MTRAEELALLDEEPFGVLGTTGPSGHPHLVTLGFAMDGPDTVVATSFPAAQKVINAHRSDLASFLVERTAPYDQIRGVLLRGRLEVITDSTAVRRCYQLVKDQSARLLPTGSMPVVDDEALVAKRVALALRIDHRASWDHRRLGGVY